MSRCGWRARSGSTSTRAAPLDLTTVGRFAPPWASRRRRRAGALYGDDERSRRPHRPRRHRRWLPRGPGTPRSRGNVEGGRHAGDDARVRRQPALHQGAGRVADGDCERADVGIRRGDDDRRDRGGLSRFDLRGRLGAEGIVARGSSVGKARAELAVTGVRTPAMASPASGSTAATCASRISPTAVPSGSRSSSQMIAATARTHSRPTALPRHSSSSRDWAGPADARSRSGCAETRRARDGWRRRAPRASARRRPGRQGDASASRESHRVTRWAQAGSVAWLVGDSDACDRHRRRDIDRQRALATEPACTGSPGRLLDGNAFPCDRRLAHATMKRSMWKRTRPFRRSRRKCPVFTSRASYARARGSLRPPQSIRPRALPRRPTRCAARARRQ